MYSLVAIVFLEIKKKMKKRCAREKDKQGGSLSPRIEGLVHYGLTPEAVHSHRQGVSVIHSLVHCLYLSLHHDALFTRLRLPISVLTLMLAKAKAESAAAHFPSSGELPYDQSGD